MQPMKILTQWLRQNVGPDHYLFSTQDFRALFPALSDNAFKTLLTRTVQQGVLEKICRSIYAYESAQHSNGLLLFHVASLLRSGEFNYLSLETVLSDAGVISQIPINSISFMSSGRSSQISCGKYGTIEFVHTTQKPEQIMSSFVYDANCRIWRANVQLALSDMKHTHRNCDLVNWELANEFV